MRVILQLILITTAVCIQGNSNLYILGDNSVTTIKVSGYAIYEVNGRAVTSRSPKSNVFFILSKVEYYKRPSHRNLIIFKYCTISPYLGYYLNIIIIIFFH